LFESKAETANAAPKGSKNFVPTRNEFGMDLAYRKDKI